MSRLLRRVGTVLLAVVALAVVAAGWLEEVPLITAAQAVEVTEHAFGDAGIDARVEPGATAGSYQPFGRPRVDVWKTRAAVRGSYVRLFLQRSDANPVFIDDRTPDGAARVLSDAQFEAVVVHADNPALTEHARRNVALTVGASAILGMAVALLGASDPTRSS